MTHESLQAIYAQRKISYSECEDDRETSDGRLPIGFVIVVVVVKIVIVASATSDMFVVRGIVAATYS